MGTLCFNVNVMSAEAWSLFGRDSRNRGIRYSDLRKPIPTAPYENRQNVTAVRTEFGQSWYSWPETSPWGRHSDPIPRELFDLRTGDLNISEKELHVYFIPVCVLTCARTAAGRGMPRVAGEKKTGPRFLILDGRIYGSPWFLCGNEGINLCIFFYLDIVPMRL